jgi:hypothetical protein
MGPVSLQNRCPAPQNYRLAALGPAGERYARRSRMPDRPASLCKHVPSLRVRDGGAEWYCVVCDRVLLRLRREGSDVPDVFLWQRAS